ncbi:MAG: glycosyl hydrolase [Myxococcota bacterium]|nr:glycosyl hydrolase [Myxococcota bacterium]
MICRWLALVVIVHVGGGCASEGVVEQSDAEVAGETTTDSTTAIEPDSGNERATDTDRDAVEGVGDASVADVDGAMTNGSDPGEMASGETSAGRGMDDGMPRRDTAGSDAMSEGSNKSFKRGIAYNMVQNEDFVALQSGVSWWYNWYFKTDASLMQASESEMTFIPMLWGRNAESDYDELERWLLDHPEIQHVLVLNEPNLVDQANMAPVDAVSEWVRYEAFQDRMQVVHGRSIRLVGPAMTWGTLPGFEDPIIWMDAFIDAFKQIEGREPRIDVLAFHWYDYGLDEQLTRLKKYGKTFWVTEMANWHREQGWTIDTPEKQRDTMIDMVRICEARDDVERYAWFMGRWDPDPHFTSLFDDEPGALTPLGEAYLIQPW